MNLLFDSGRLWFRRGRYGKAIELFRRSLVHVVGSESHRAATLALLARAAAETGDSTLFLDSWERAWALVQRDPARERATAADLIRAAVTARDLLRANRAVGLLRAPEGERGADDLEDLRQSVRDLRIGVHERTWERGFGA